MGIYLPGAGTLGCAVWFGAGIAGSQGIPPDFYLLHVNVGSPVSILPLPPALCTRQGLLTSLSSLHISTPTTYLDECGFFGVRLPYSLISNSSGCYLF